MLAVEAGDGSYVLDRGALRSDLPTYWVDGGVCRVLDVAMCNLTISLAQPSDMSTFARVQIEQGELISSAVGGYFNVSQRIYFSNFSAHADGERRGLDRIGGWHRRGLGETRL